MSSCDRCSICSIFSTIRLPRHCISYTVVTQGSWRDKVSRIPAEPYSLAIAAHRAQVNIRIIATDIDNRALARAKLGRYGEAEIKDIPADVVDEYFEDEGDKWSRSRSAWEHCLAPVKLVARPGPSRGGV